MKWTKNVDSMDLSNEVVFAIKFLVTRPFSLAMLFCVIVLRSICAITQTWIEIVLSFLCFQLSITWKSIICATGILSLPVRALSALRREKMLEMHLQDLQTEVEKLISEKRKLDQRLLVVINQHKLLQEMFAELEDEHDEAVSKLEVLQGELESLKIENRRLKEAKNQAIWRTTDDMNSGHSDIIKTSTASSGNRKQNEKHENNDKTTPTDNEKASSDVSDHMKTCSMTSDEEGTLELRKEVSTFQSAFSVLMAILVGMVVLEAQDPCMPLVVALFAVTVMSLRSSLGFFSTVRNKPANLAVALLGLNWFILGTLTSPMLPTIAHMLSPSVLRAYAKVTNWWFCFVV